MPRGKSDKIVWDYDSLAKRMTTLVDAVERDLGARIDDLDKRLSNFEIVDPITDKPREDLEKRLKVDEERLRHQPYFVLSSKYNELVEAACNVVNVLDKGTVYVPQHLYRAIEALRPLVKK